MCPPGVKVRNTLSATVEVGLLLVLLVGKVHLVKIAGKLVEEEIKIRLRRRSRCLEANLLSFNRSLTGLFVQGC